MSASVNLDVFGRGRSSVDVRCTSKSD